MTTIRSDRDGFALPMVILVIGFMTAGVLAAFARSTSEVQLVDNHRTETRAYALAESGLSDFLLRTRLTPAETTFVYAGGTATVKVTTMRAAPTAKDTSLHIIRSVGMATAGANRPPATRAVTQFALRVPTSLDVRAGWTSLSGMTKSGADGDLTGVDQCGEETAVAGVGVPNGQYSQSGNPSVPDSIAHMGSQNQMKDEIKIDWAGIVNDGAITADVYIPPGSFPTATQFSNPDYWPVIYIDHGPTGSFDLPHSGRGTLIVEGNLTIGGGKNWDGVIMVGGALNSNGENTVEGAVISGLNVKLGMTVSASSVGSGEKFYRYDSCKVARAMANVARFYAMTNAWTDNSASW